MQQEVFAAVDATLAATEPYVAVLSEYNDVAWNTIGMNVVDQWFVEMSEVVGFPVDQLKLVLLLLLNYPLAYVHRALPGARLKHVFSILIGFFSGWLCFGLNTLHHIAVALVVYAQLLVLPASVCRFSVFAFLMVYTCTAHVYRMYVDYMGWTMDFTGPLMVMTIKLSSLAYNYYDGVTSFDEKKIDSRVIAERKALSIPAVPSLLEYFGFVYFFAGFLVGPPFEVRAYLDLCNGKLFDNCPDKKMPSGATVTGFLKMISAFVTIGIVTALGSFTLRPTTLTPEFAAEHIVWRFLFVCVAVRLMRFKYYFAWYLADGAFIISGLGFNGFTADGIPMWNRVTNANVLGVEAGPNIRSVTSNWNLGAAAWLKRYVYLRINEGKKPGALNTFMTYAISAAWHGFYPGYYLFFFSGALFTELSKYLRKHIRPKFIAETRQEKGKTVEVGTSLKPVYDIACIILTAGAIDYGGVAFGLLDWNDSIYVWGMFYFVVHWVGFFVFIYYTFIHKFPKKPKKE